MPPTLRPPCRAAAALIFVGFASKLAAESALPKESPFIPAGAPTVTAPSGEVYEFAAVSTIGTKTSVNIFDKQAKKGKWIPVGDTADGITVKSYDAKRELVVVRIGGADKTLALRKASGVANVPVMVPGATAPVAVFNTTNNTAAPATPPVVTSGMTAADVPVVMGATPGTPAPTTPVAPPPTAPPAPGSVEHQEREARLLVSDLLEIGVAQRKAYEEAQKRAGQPAPAPAAPPAAPTPAK